MSIKVREKDVEGYLVRALETIGVPCLKFIPDGKVGMPDRVILMGDGRVLWVELKTDSGHLSPVQCYRHKELRDIGQAVEVVWNKEQADRLVDKIRQEGIEKEYSIN